MRISSSKRHRLAVDKQTTGMGLKIIRLCDFAEYSYLSNRPCAIEIDRNRLTRENPARRSRDRKRAEMTLNKATEEDYSCSSAIFKENRPVVVESGWRV